MKPSPSTPHTLFLRQLKQMFDVLGYPDKLKFWDSNDECNYHYNTLFINDVPDEERLKTENHLSIYPANMEETALYNNWLLNHYVADNHRCNIEKLKIDFFKTVDKNPLPVEFAEAELSAIDAELERDKKLQSHFRYYTMGYNGVIKNRYPHLQADERLYNYMLSYAMGIAHAHYKGFVREQLRKLKAGEPLYAIADAPIPLSIKSIVEKHFAQFESEFNTQHDYVMAIDTVTAYFNSNKITISKPLFIKNGNIKKFAFAMGQIWRTQKNEPFTFQYLQLYKQAFSIFKEQKLDPKNLQAMPLYKYSLSQT